MLPSLAPTIQPGARWIPPDGELVRSYVSADETKMYAMVSRTADGWDAFDLTQLNASQTGPLSIGHFETVEKAQGAAEMWFTVIQ
jgi:hypothetical protein